LYLFKKELKEDLYKGNLVKAIIMSNAPYREETLNGIISVLDDLEVSLSPIRKEISRDDEISDEELAELRKKI